MVLALRHIYLLLRFRGKAHLNAISRFNQLRNRIDAMQMWNSRNGLPPPEEHSLITTEALFWEIDSGVGGEEIP